MPERIQLRRTKGWRKPQGAVVVSRPSKWGNPWNVRPENDHRGWSVQREGSNASVAFGHGRTEAHQLAVDCYRNALQHGLLDIVPLEVERDLAGRDLACWCPLDQPCHADVLLEIANPEERA